MIEPVAYWHIPKFENDEPFVSFDRYDGHDFEDTPLYTFEDLHPRVKMTQSEFDEFDDLYRIHMTVFGALDEILGNPNYKNLKKGLCNLIKRKPNWQICL